MKNLFFTLLLCFVVNITYCQDHKFGKVSMQELEENTHPIDSSANAAILYKKEIIKFDYVQSQGFVQSRELHMRIKIYNNKGFDWATQKVWLYRGRSKESLNSLKAFTYNLIDGRIVKDKLSKSAVFEEKYNEAVSTKSFTMPNVKVGSVIEFTYRISSDRYSIDDLIFQYNIPINELEVKVSTPEYLIYNKQVNLRAKFLPKLNNSSRRVTSPFSYIVNVTSLNHSNIPPLVSEPFSDNKDNFRSKMSFELSTILNGDKLVEKTFSNSWEKVSKTIYDNPNFGGQINKANSFFSDELSVITENAANDNEKIFLITSFLKSKVKWNGNSGKYARSGIRKAYKEGSGNVADVNLLLIAMLRSQGIVADPVLVSTRANGIPLFPTLDGFNYVICMAKVEGNAILLDATEKYSSNNVLPERVINWRGRLIKKDGISDWVNLRQEAMSSVVTMLNAKLEDDFSISGKVRKNYTLYRALGYRKKYNVLSVDESVKQHEDHKGDIEISNLEYENKNDLFKPVKISYDFDLSDAVDEIGDKIYIKPLLFLANDENPFKLEQRQYPIDFIVPLQEKFIVNIMLPNGYSIESLPEKETFVFKDANTKFSYLISQSGNFIRLSCVLSLKTPIIDPTEYADFKAFFTKMIEKQAEQVVLIKS